MTVVGLLISLLLPTRGRPNELQRLAQSVIYTADNPAGIEIVTYHDDDDPAEYGDWWLDLPLGRWATITGPRYHDGQVNLSAKWNICYEHCRGDIIMHCGDDIVFRTPGWDTIVNEAFEQDKILFAFGRDGYQDGNNFGTHGFIHREWVDAVGYLFPPLFVSDYNDTFLNDVSKLIGRHREIPIYTEHMHYCVGKAEIDLNTRERLERHQAARPDLLYDSPQVQDEIRAAADRLGEAMTCAGLSES